MIQPKLRKRAMFDVADLTNNDAIRPKDLRRAAMFSSEWMQKLHNQTMYQTLYQLLELNLNYAGDELVVHILKLNGITAYADGQIDVKISDVLDHLITSYITILTAYEELGQRVFKQKQRLLRQYYNKRDYESLSEELLQVVVQYDFD